MDKYSDIGCLIDELVSDNYKIKNEAWAYFIKQYGRLIYHCIKKILSYKAPQEDIEDCFQDIIRKLLKYGCRRIKEIHFSNEKAFRSWLGTVATRSAMNFSRRKKKVMNK